MRGPTISFAWAYSIDFFSGTRIPRVLRYMFIPGGYRLSLPPLIICFLSFCPSSPMTSFSTTSTPARSKSLTSLSVMSASRGISARYAVRYAPILSTFSMRLVVVQPWPHSLYISSFGMKIVLHWSKRASIWRCHAPRSWGSTTVRSSASR